MVTPTTIRAASTWLSSALAVLAVCLPVAVYESLEHQLAEWVPASSADVVQVDLLPAGLLTSVQAQSEGRIEGLALFQAPFLATPETNAATASGGLPVFTANHIEAILTFPTVEGLAWLRTYPGNFDTPVGSFGIRLAPPQYFDYAGWRFDAGRSPTEGDPADVVVLGYEAYRALFGSEDAVGQRLAPGAGGYSQPLTVIGVLSPAGPANALIARYLDRAFYLPDREALDQPVPGAPPIILPVTTLWIKPKPNQQAALLAELHRYLPQALGPAVEPHARVMGDYARLVGGIQTRQAFLLRFAWALALVVGVAILTLGSAVYVLLLQRRFELGVRRSVGAARRWLIVELQAQAIPRGLLAGLIGAALAVPLAPWVGTALQFCSFCQPVPIRVGWLTVAVGAGLAAGMWSLGTALPAWLMLRSDPVGLLRDTSLAGQSRRGHFISGLGYALAVAALLATLGLRDGTMAQVDRILGWSGGERAGAFVGWRTRQTPVGEDPAELSPYDYHQLLAAFPDTAFGWLSHKGVTAQIDTLEASASLAWLRPPALAAGRWFTSDEEEARVYVAVLGPDLARRLADEQGMAPGELLGQTWRAYAVVGVMEAWPALTSMGYYADVAYVPVGVMDAGARHWAPGGQIAFVVPQGVDFAARIDKMRAAIQPSHPEGKPQLILPGAVVGDLLAWRSRLYLVLGMLASVSLLIGGVGIMNQVFVWVVGHWREIGIRRAVGASQSDIARLILGQALTLTLGATVAGSAVGTGLALLIQRQSGWPLALYPWALAASAATALLSALLLGGIPMAWAATSAPTEALRLE